jgi:hypothetical protein
MTQQLRIRWIRLEWLSLDQAVIYGGFPSHVLRELIAHRRVRTREGGRLIRRDSIDEILAESVIRREPIFWSERRHG